MSEAAIERFVAASDARWLGELGELLAIPSVSALPAHAADVRRCAEWTAAALARAGLEHARVVETAGHPIVRADWLHAPGGPTVLCYGHYDVQPVDPLDAWLSPPFEPAVRDGRLYARGATDDKGQLFVHLAAVEAHLSATGRLPVNLQVLIEGEEEIGCRHLTDYVR
ncbi:MAG TPA: M20/M25/M40 family metallo-hydrolase, partial [Anaeromyxobacteraceae bacterium]|nr:M20/M25/M40 family metallo-hydrolase [Anaeromyxobacteraceae bacterium]